MKKETKKVWKEMEKLGWSNKPKDFHLEYFEDIIEATKQAFSLSYCCEKFCVKYDKDTQIQLLIELAERLGKEKK